MKILTKDLIGPPLDWATAKALGLRLPPYPGRGGKKECWINVSPCSHDLFAPSTSGDTVIDIMERESIGVLPPDGHRYGAWRAFVYEPSQFDLTFKDALTHTMYGATMRIAACKTFVAARLGDEVDIPDELLP